MILLRLTILLVLGCTAPCYAGLVLPAAVLDSLAPGDIIVRKGGGPLSSQLMNISKEDYSHCGIVVFHDNEWMVIQSIGNDSHHPEDGVQLSPIADFVKFTADSNLFICRSRIQPGKSDELAARAFFYLNKKVPFDYRFSLTDSSRFYCSELLLHIFIDVYGEPVFEIRPQHQTYVPLFATFFDASRFRMIFNFDTP